MHLVDEKMSFDFKELHDKAAVFIGGIPEDVGPFATNKYHDWNHIMGWIETIETYGKYKFGIYTTLATVIDVDKNDYIILVKMADYPKGFSKIDMVWQVIDKFIDWYCKENRVDKFMGNRIITDEPNFLQIALENEYSDTQKKSLEAAEFIERYSVKPLTDEEIKDIQNGNHLEPVTPLPLTPEQQKIVNANVYGSIVPDIKEYQPNFVPGETGIMFVYDGNLRTATVNDMYAGVCICEITADDGTYDVKVPQSQVIGVTSKNSPIAKSIKGFMSKYILFQPDHYQLKNRIE